MANHQGCQKWNDQRYKMLAERHTEIMLMPWMNNVFEIQIYSKRWKIHSLITAWKFGIRFLSDYVVSCSIDNNYVLVEFCCCIAVGHLATAIALINSQRKTDCQCHWTDVNSTSMPTSYTKLWN